jgi:hypothetical protein
MGQWEIKTNRHPNTDGTPWGCIDERIPPTKERPYWTTREVRRWSGVSDRARAAEECAEHNAAEEAPDAE